MPSPMIQGINHVALTVNNLQQTVRFFTETLGYDPLGEDPSYPAAFLTDGTTMMTFWQAKQPDAANAFDRHHNLGLHHLALTVVPGQLDALYLKLKANPECQIEFEPELSYGGPKRHMMCAIPGSGIRVEFTESPTT